MKYSRPIKSPFLLLAFLLVSHTYADAGSSMTLTIHESITLAIAKNYFVKVSGFDPKIAAQEVSKAKGSFDPIIGTEYSRREFDVLNENGDIVTSTSDRETSSLFLRGVMPWGTRYLLEINEDQLKTLDNTGQSHSSDADYSIEITQPLLRGLGLADRYASTRLAMNRSEIQNWVFTDVIMRTVRNVVNNYAQLYFAKKNLAISRQSLELAQKLYDDNRKRVAVGRVAEYDIIRAEANYARRQEDVINAKRRLHIQANRFKLLISDELESLINYDINIQDFVEPAEFEYSVLSDFKQALDLRPDYQQALLGINARRIEVKRDKRQALPTLDLVFRYDRFGTAQNNDSAFDSLRDHNAGSTYTGLSFSIPITNQEGRARVRTAELALEKKELDVARLKQAILLDIDNAAAVVASHWERIQAAQKALEITEKELDATQKRFDAGRGNSFFVINTQERLANARIRKILALSDFYRALADYYYETGQILRVYKVGIPI